MKIVITGSSGLIGSEVASYFDALGHSVYGIDNNSRAYFFGPQGDTRWNQKRLETSLLDFKHIELDIRNRNDVLQIFNLIKPDAVIHTAAQPSHDKAASIPFDDFDTNAVGTLNLLEATKQVCADSPFVHLSTNKVYGDSPNRIEFKEMEYRWEYDDLLFKDGIDENLTIDQSTHSLFGASKLAADILVQEYGRYFHMPTCCLRGGCLTGPNHSGVELHGFLSYLIKCNLEKREYKIYGYKGKQVRDNIHAYDVARFIEAFINNPRYGEVYNLGGGKDNSISILEAFRLIENITGNRMIYTYVTEHRIGDHICYYSNLSKIHQHYPEWSISKNLEVIFHEIAQSWLKRIQ